jgi:hypothetical protein
MSLLDTDGRVIPPDQAARRAGTTCPAPAQARTFRLETQVEQGGNAGGIFRAGPREGVEPVSGDMAGEDPGVPPGSSGSTRIDAGPEITGPSNARSPTPGPAGPRDSGAGSGGIFPADTPVARRYTVRPSLFTTRRKPARPRASTSRGPAPIPKTLERPAPSHRGGGPGSATGRGSRRLLAGSDRLGEPGPPFIEAPRWRQLPGRIVTALRPQTRGRGPGGRPGPDALKARAAWTSDRAG